MKPYDSLPSLCVWGRERERVIGLSVSRPTCRANARVRGGVGGLEWYGGRGGVHELTMRVGGV